MMYAAKWEPWKKGEKESFKLTVDEHWFKEGDTLIQDKNWKNFLKKLKKFKTKEL